MTDLSDFEARRATYPVCPRCANHWPELERADNGANLCAPCRREADDALRKSAIAARLIANLVTVVRGELLRAGMSAREIDCRREDVTAEIGKALRDGAHAVSLLDGIVPARGFGISASAGGGKTGAIAVCVHRLMAARLERELARVGSDALTPFLLWLSWPDTVNRLRIFSTGDGGIAEVDRFVAQAIEIEALVLDDVGAERLKGSYFEDWSASQLDLIIDARHRADRPTWFTTTLAREELIARYGARLFSRLVGQNPLVEMGPLPDRRMARRRA